MPNDTDQRRLVIPLTDIRAADLPIAGGKGANLGELLHAGFPVPDGFVVTTAAYAALLAETGLGTTLAELVTAPAADGRSGAGSAPDGSAIRSAFAAAPMPAAVRAEIFDAYRASGGGAVAVRSSATAEDLPGAAFAGQQDTYLDIVGEDAVLEAVRNCWASLWTDRAIAYRQREGIDPGDVAIAVVVQTMVPADVAGVLFTADPVSGRRDQMVVDASPGLGEAVVSGMVTPDHYVVAQDGRVLQRVPGASQNAGGDSAMRAGFVLSDPQLSELAAVGKRAADHFGTPQDLEWAFAGGSLHVLQARPMTALPPAPANRAQPARLNPFQRKLGPFFLEMFQQRPYPLDVDGWLKHGIVAMLHRMAGSVGVAFPSLARLLPEEDGVVVRLVPPVPRPTPRVLFAPVSIAKRLRRFDPARWTSDPRFVAFQASVKELKHTEPAGMPWAELLAHVRRIFAVSGTIADLRVSYLPASFVPQVPMRLVLLALGKTGLAPTLLTGALTRTEQANRGLENLADLVRADAALTGAFDDLDPAHLLDVIRTEAHFAAFARHFDAFLNEYGHRETVSLVLSSSPTWADAPEAVLGLVKVLIPAKRAAQNPAADALNELMAHPALRVGWLRRLTVAAVEGSRTGTAFRDDSHFYLTSLLPTLRRAYAELGERLHEAGVIQQPSDVYQLRFEELSGIRDPARLQPEQKRRYSDAVAARAARRAELEGVPLLDADALFAGRQAAAGALVTGMGASRGTATGRVRVITDPSGFGTLRSGEVLVCPYTNPAWTPLFQRAAGVVVDAGGMASHAAIVAREYGVPAVMGTGTGTQVLTDGQLVTVDGTRGIVTDARI